ncbi:MAG: S8 family serine peptidase [Actinomycetales bacterium]|nr:S8 family serine peptidase [Actinomycetales bacterium]
MSRSPVPRTRRRRLAALTLTTGLVVAGLATAGVPANATGPDDGDGGGSSPAVPFRSGRYIVQLTQPPVAAYDGGVSGLPATRPVRGSRLNPDSTNVRAYRSHLRKRQVAMLKTVNAKPTHQYTLAINGFTAQLTARQAAKLAGQRGVLSVTRDELYKPALIESPGKLGLTGKSGVWTRLGGAAKAGRGIVVGVVDTGVWPENPSFAGKPVTTKTPGGVGSTYRTGDGRIAVVKADRSTFVGDCEEGASDGRFPASTCNDKIVSARYFTAGFAGSVPREEWSDQEYESPRDGDGHGSHTASTAAGNRVPNVTIQGESYGAVSGMAPAAKLAIYKACYTAADPDLTGCYASDTVAAIDTAIDDGVDVINYSIGGSSPDNPTHPAEVAFLSAAAAGIFVAGAAGNDGPTPSTVDKNTPWVTSVASSTIHRFEGTAKLGNGKTYRGASFAVEQAGPAPLVLSDQIAATGASTSDAALCQAGSLDPAKAAGKIVVCDRGIIARVAKSAEVARAGGVGMILVNVNAAEGLDADVHPVPTIHVAQSARSPLRDYATTAGSPTATLLTEDTTGLPATPVPQVAGTSSRGPALVNGGDLLKPDIIAPGVSIVAAVVPDLFGGDDYNPLSGTSMASPHVAGLAALVLSAHPTWSPMAVKSALMTSAVDLFSADGTKSTNPFHQGAGFVHPTRALNPGLIYNSGIDDWMAWLEGVGIDTGTGTAAIDPSNFNSPSISIGQLAGTQTVTRRVTTTAKGTYRATASVPGTKITVSPSSLTFAKAGQTKSFKVKITRTSAALDTYTTGFLTWKSHSFAVRSPIAVKPVKLSAPEEVHGTGASGTATYTVVPGATESIHVSVGGLVPGQVEAGSIEAGEYLQEPGGNASTAVYRFTVPDGTRLARFDLVAAEQSHDFDLFVVDPEFTGLVALSASGAADERVDLADPEPGEYYVLVNAYSTGEDAKGAFTLRNFAVGETAAGNLTVSPDPIPGVMSQRTTVSLSWSGLNLGYSRRSD